MSDSNERSCLEMGALLLAERQRQRINFQQMTLQLGLTPRQLIALETGDKKGFGFTEQLFKDSINTYATKLGLEHMGRPSHEASSLPAAIESEQDLTREFRSAWR